MNYSVNYCKNQICTITKASGIAYFAAPFLKANPMNAISTVVVAALAMNVLKMNVVKSTLSSKMDAKVIAALPWGLGLLGCSLLAPHVEKTLNALASTLPECISDVCNKVSFVVYALAGVAAYLHSKKNS